MPRIQHEDKFPFDVRPGPADSSIFTTEDGECIADNMATAYIPNEYLDIYLTYQYVPGPGTIWKEVSRIPPASILVCEGTGKIETKKYWNLDFTQKTRLTFKDACEHIRHMLTESTKICMKADVPVGAFLSGGFDSSIVVGLMTPAATIIFM